MQVTSLCSSHRGHSKSLRRTSRIALGVFALSGLFACTAVLHAAASSTTDNCNSPSVPEPAARQSYTKLIFCDDFTSTSTIDITGSGRPGFKWYTNRPYNLGVLPPQDYKVANGVLSVTDYERFQTNRALQTMDPVTGNGQTFLHGYFEARIHFDPKLGPGNPGWPAVWLTSADHVLNPTGVTHYPELDIFEVIKDRKQPGMPYTSFMGTVHDWRAGKDSTPSKPHEVRFYFNHDNVQEVRGTDWNGWHIVAALWTPNESDVVSRRGTSHVSIVF